jgi:S-DNA-T family DNA segregation ATPase FtsK/SpoIIIE
MVVDALCRIGLPGMTLQTAERVHEETRVMAPGVATSAHGYVMEMELTGVTAEMVVAKRANLAGELRRDVGCVWPSGNEDKHPNYLRLFLSHRPMNTGRQPAWPLMKARAVDSFDGLPLFTDEEMRWVCLTLAGTHTAVGGASGFGKSVWLRHLTCALAYDLRARLYLFDGKRSGDLDHVRKLAHAFHEGAEPEDIEAIVAELEGLVAECTRRAKFLKSLPADERSPKVTSALASKYAKQLAPIFAVFDEVQEYTEYGITKEERKIRETIVGLLTKLSRVGRSAGIFLVLTSQKPDAKVIPSAIMGNCSIRIAFKVSDQVHNDQILGTSARKSGIDATMFGSRDRGMAWLKGGDAVDAQVVRSWSEMVDVGLAVELADKAYELRQADGWLTGQAAGEDIEDAIVVDVVADALSVVDSPEHGGRHISLQMLAEKLRELRPTTWDRVDQNAVGALLRAKHVMVDSIWCPAEGRSMQGVKREWLLAGDDT